VLTALALLLIQAPDAPPVRWECSRGMRQEGGLLMVVRRLDADGRFVADHLRWLVHPTDGQSSRIEWALSGNAPGAVRGWSMWSTVSLSRPPSGRMWAIVRADGRELSRSPVSLPPLGVRDGEGRLQVMLDYRAGPPDVFGPPTAPMPGLGEARNVEILIEEAGGGQLARVRLAMPNWALARPEVGLARDVLGEDVAAYRTRCRDITIPVRIRWEVQPGR
jgi:hypothetical protein